MDLITLRRQAPTATTDSVDTVRVSATALALLVAIIAAIPPIVTTVTGIFLQPLSHQTTTALESRKASADLYRRALTIDDAGQRYKVVQFLLNTQLVDENGVIRGTPQDQLPHWPAAAATSP